MKKIKIVKKYGKMYGYTIILRDIMDEYFVCAVDDNGYLFRMKHMSSIKDADTWWYVISNIDFGDTIAIMPILAKYKIEKVALELCKTTQEK